MEDTGAPRYQLQKGQVAAGATPFHRIAPVYPPAQLDACRPSIEVHALLIVDGNGKVGEARVAEEAAADASTKAFIAAVNSAVVQWTFVPLRIRNGTDTGAEQATAGDETRAFSLPYVFRFDCHEGQSSVSSDR
jgi:hypothetical protein